VFSHELFMENDARIHITSFKQAQEVKKFYEEEYGLDRNEHTIHVHNWNKYPYLFHEYGGIHGCSHMKDEYPTIEFDQWKECVGALEESEQDLKLLLI